MDDWVSAGLGAWLGRRWFAPWFKRHPSVGRSLFVIGSTVAAAVLILFH
jgi:hypothetical protein